MLTYDDVNKQNDKITELTNVLTFLLSDRALYDTQVISDLFFELVKEVEDHLKTQDKFVYRTLLASPDQKVRNMSNKFMSGGVEIKRVFAEYLKVWCDRKSKKCKQLYIKDHVVFVRETEEMFELILNRIQDEQEKLFPMLRKVTGDDVVIAK
ncbi:MAG: hemerythrin domain-containing protein [Gammaproteobacteria bacterium]|nr:hemerythrin domain-containing protein [Gammaproteobacteria bacterium]